MSINNIKKLSMNPHFYSLLMQSFLSGYEKPCEIKLPFMAIPILLYAESREKLVNANRRSRIDTLFQSPQIIDERKISGKTRLSGYIDRYNSLKPYCKEAIIILSSEGKITVIRDARNMVVHNGGRIYKEFDKYDKFKIGYREEDHQLYLEYNDIVKMYDAILDFMDRTFRIIPQG